MVFEKRLAFIHQRTPRPPALNVVARRFPYIAVGNGRR
jgi:hypothetical protein